MTTVKRQEESGGPEGVLNKVIYVKVGGRVHVTKKKEKKRHLNKRRRLSLEMEIIS